MDKIKETQQPVTELSFEELSKAIVTRFLQTIVVVDDQAFLHTGDATLPHAGLTPPPVIGVKKIVPPTKEDTNTVEDSTHQLNAKDIIDTFAEKGLICGVLRPNLDEQFEQKTIKVAERADIIILDWQLQGTTRPDVDASDLIVKILTDENSQDRIRLIAIYSVEVPSTIVSKLDKTLRNLGVLSIEDDGYTLQLKKTKICLFAKEGTKGANASRIVNEKNLPDKLIIEFTKMTMGLLSNAALESMSALRKNMHRIIGKFNPLLDAAYLSHRALLRPAEEAESHIVPLLVSEIQAVLEDQQISDYVSDNYIRRWVEKLVRNIPDYETRMDIKSTDKEKAKESLIDLLCKGVAEESTSKSYPGWNKFLDPLKVEKNGDKLSKLTNILTQDGSSGSTVDREFAYLMSICTRYENQSPILKLGSIVALDSSKNTNYMLCIQPSCDSVRLPDKRKFPFLRMPNAANSGVSDFGFVIRDKDKSIDLRLSLRIYELEMFEFKREAKTKCVVASKDNGSWMFKTTDKIPVLLRWVADLKPLHAQRVANEYAREISRVGLTESEWLRRCALKG